MNIRAKVLTLLSLLFLLLGIAQILIQRQVLMPSFAQLERDEARTAMRRVEFALDAALDRLQTNATDWGNWADTYDFARTHAPAFAAANLTPIGLRQLNVNLMLVVDESGRVILQSARDLRTGQPLDLDVARLSALPADFPWLSALRSGRPAQGLLSTNLGVLLAAASPILDGTGRGPARGMVIMGRLLKDAEIESLGAAAQVHLRRSAARTNSEELVESESDTQVFRSFQDIHGNSVLTLGVEIPRRISARGETAIAYASVYLAVAGAGVLLALMFLINRLVLSPLAKVTRHAAAIGAGNELERPLNLSGGGEIGMLARELDRMVERLGEARRQLVDRSFQAGFAELARGVLHNLGNAVTPLGVRIAGLHDRLRQMPVQDMQRAAAELAQAPGDDPRRADLTQFMLLGAREMAAGVQLCTQDIAVMQRQTAVIQATLGEQMKSSSAEAVIEPVRLPDLVTQTLEIVPDQCRQRLSVETDDSLRRIGVVRVARTVLRLILQNFIINAADAVREAGRDRGRLRLAAEILTDQGGSQLHLICEDDGAGIAPDHLQRVFDKGFSTKSHDTNHGIGLHWCANAIASLGGRIWAHSEGLGTGASLHVLLPLTSTPAAPAAHPA